MLNASQAEKILAADFSNLVKKVKSGRTLTAGERAIVQARLGTSPKPDLPATETNKARLAEHLGTTRQNLNKWKKDKTFPKPDSAGRYNVAACIEWTKRNGRGPTANEDEPEALKAQRLLLQNALLQIELDIKKGRYTETAIVTDKIRSMAEQLKATLKALLEEQLPPRLEGLRAAEIKKKMRSTVDQICETLSTGSKKWTH
jgi:hypothetical protein